MQSHVWNMACPDVFVMSIDGRVAIATLLARHLNVHVHRMPPMQEQLAVT